MQNKLELLYIDDEVNNLLGFKANFRYRYVVYTASNTRDAEDLLEAHPGIRIIFCDQKMPDELGVDFLHRIKKKYPKPIRMLLTAYADLETVIDAVNKGHIFRFVRKPWLEEEIVSSIEEADKFYVTSSLLAIKNDELQRAYDELDKFAYSVSHDLRDPLVGVLGAIRLARQFDRMEDVQELLELMSDSLVRLDAYIDSLRDYYLLRRGELHLSEIRFSDLFENIGRFYRIYTQNSDVTLQIEVDQAEVYRSDKAILELILHNLLSNAFKYQQLDGNTKSVYLEAAVRNGVATITVRDTGIGIASEQLGDIFNLFFRGSDQAKGMGFGLYNVQSALRKLQGEIKVSSQLGVGTLFTITIPTK